MLFLLLVFSLRLYIDQCNQRRLGVQTGKKEKQSLFIFHTEIKLSDWLDKTFSGQFFSSTFFSFWPQLTHTKKKSTTHVERGRGAEA